MFAIPNCDTVKKARNFLDAYHIEYEFIDFKKIPPTEAQIKRWSEFAGELVINKKGLTYRKHKEQFEALNPTEKIAFIIANTSLIKRPILERKEQTIAVGLKKSIIKN